jgi:hypothetical protein
VIQSAVVELQVVEVRQGAAFVIVAVPQVGLEMVSAVPRATQPRPVMAPAALPLAKVTVVPLGATPVVTPVVPPVGNELAPVVLA